MNRLNVPPPLPLRHQLPPPDPPATAQLPTGKISDDLNRLLFRRQAEVYAQLGAPPVLAALALHWQTAVASDPSIDAYTPFVDGSYVKLVEFLQGVGTVLGQTPGLPASARRDVYLAVTRCKNLSLENEYDKLSAPGTVCALQDELGMLFDDYDAVFNSLRNTDRLSLIRNTLRAFTVHTHRVPSAFVVNAAVIIHYLLVGAAWLPAEVFQLVVRLDKVYLQLVVEAWVFKLGRLWEDKYPEEYQQVVTAGLSSWHKKVVSLELVRDMVLRGDATGAALADLFVLQGFDFLARVWWELLTVHVDKVRSLDPPEATQLLSEGMWEDIDAATLALCLANQAPFVKYENEYSLLHNASVNLNHTELANLRHANEELVAKQRELQAKFERLTANHMSMMQELSDVQQQLKAQEARNHELAEKRAEIETKVKRLDMHEEIMQTRQRNEDIARMNQEALENLAHVRQRLEERKAELAQKMQAAAAA